MAKMARRSIGFITLVLKLKTRYLFRVRAIVTIAGYLCVLTPLSVNTAAVCWASPSVESKPAVIVAPVGLRNYRLVFHDEFDTLNLGTGIRSAISNQNRWYEGVWFNPRHAPRDRFTVANSELSLEWKLGQQQPDSSISTFHAWRYGYFEARMKWNPIEGAWPAFRLIPVPPTPESGEIDIFEGQGGEPHTFFRTIHRWIGSRELESSAQRNRFPVPAHTDFASYHTYGLLWTPGRVTWYFDGAPLHSEPPYSIFDKRDYLMILGMQEGVNWKSGDMTGVMAQSLTLTVDWVRIWQH
jgi:beta-glucanase (GH16 family)